MVDTICMDAVQSVEVSWLWDGYIPLGTVTLLIGDGGLGKSFCALAIASAVTMGTPLPDSPKSLPPSDVIIQNAENPLAAVVKPRLVQLGADCSKVHVINENEKRLSLIDERLEQAIVQHKARYVCLDPLQSYLGDRFSMNRAESVRSALTHLEQVAERTNSGILLVGHLNKSSGTKAAYRGLGSIDIINSVPSVLYLGDLEDGIRAVVPGKSNLGELADPQAFSLSKAEGFCWLGKCDATLDDILNRKRGKDGGFENPKSAEAAEFLQDILSGGAMPASEVFAEAESAGISQITLKRAKAAAGVKTDKSGGHWMWSI